MQLFRRCFAALVLATLPFAPVNAQEQRVSLDQTPQLIAQLLQNGQADAARGIATAALRARPGDPVLLIQLSRAYEALGDYPAAIATGKQAWAAAKGNTDARFGAAMAVARAQDQAGALTRAQIWLRRARENAPTDETAARVAADYRALRNQNPWNTTLQFGITPSSNVNGGSASDTSTLFGLPFEFLLQGSSRALSGVEIALGVRSSYRIAASETADTSLIFAVDGRTFALSESAKAQAPDANGSDFSQATLEVGLSHRRILRDGMLPTSFDITTGKTFQEDTPDSRFVAVKLGQAFALGEQDRIDLSLSREWRYGLQDQPLVTRDGIRAAWLHSFDGGNRVGLSLDYAQSTSDAGDSDYDLWRIGTSFDLAKPIAGMQFGFGASYETRNYDFSTFAAGPREDETVSLRMNVGFSNIEYFGFTPVLNIEATRTNSDTDLFDRDYVRAGFALRSAF